MKANSGELWARISEDTEKLLRADLSSSACTLPYRGNVICARLDDGKWFVEIGPTRYCVSIETVLSIVADTSKNLPVPPWGGDWYERNGVTDGSFDGHVGSKIELSE